MEVEHVKYSLSELLPRISRLRSFEKVETLSVVEGNMFEIGAEISKKNKDKKIAILNFANNFVPVAGCNPVTDKTQEGELYRVADFHPPLSFYPIDKNYRETNLIYSTNVKFYGGTDKEYLADVLSIAALECPGILYEINGEVTVERFGSSKARKRTNKKIELMLHSLNYNDVDYFITGGWGLGVFENPLDDMVGPWEENLKSVPVKNAIFCFYGEGSQRLIRAFNQMKILL